LARLLDTASKFALFSVSGLKDKKLIKKSKPTQKLKHANPILESFEYFCQISLKSIVIILSYAVSKLTRFFETQCITLSELIKHLFVDTSKRLIVYAVLQNWIFVTFSNNPSQPLSAVFDTDNSRPVFIRQL